MILYLKNCRKKQNVDQLTIVIGVLKMKLLFVLVKMVSLLFTIHR
jgi:hypothetical protein